MIRTADLLKGETMNKRKIWIPVLLAIACMIGVGKFAIEPSYYNRIEEVRSEYMDEFEIAMSTPRISLGPAVRELNDISNRLDDINPPFWVSGDAQNYLTWSLDTLNDMTIGYMGDPDYPDIEEDLVNAAENIERYWEATPLQGELE